MKSKRIFILSALTALCMAACILDWDIVMFASGILAVAVAAADEKPEAVEMGKNVEKVSEVEERSAA